MTDIAYRQDEQEAREIGHIAGQLARETAENSYAQASDLLDIMRSNAVDLATARQYMADEQTLRDEEIAAQDARTYHARTGCNCSHGPDEHATWCKVRVS